MSTSWPPQPAAQPVISLTESQALAVLRSFLLGVVPAGVDVVQGQVNRVAQPRASDFIVFWPLSQERLGTNRVDYFDDIVTGSIAGTVLTVTAAAKLPRPLAAGTLLVDKGGLLAAGTVIGAQISGTVGGTGTYAVSPAQTVASTTMYGGTRADIAAVKMGAQIDVHGPHSGDNVRVVETLMRSEYGVAAFEASGLEVVPLYCDEPKQLPFTNDQQQVENRWVLDTYLQINPIVTTSQLFAEEVEVRAVEVVPQFTWIPFSQLTLGNNYLSLGSNFLELSILQPSRLTLGGDDLSLGPNQLVLGD